MPNNNQSKSAAIQIVSSGIKAVSPGMCVQHCLRKTATQLELINRAGNILKTIPIGKKRKIFIVGCGKAVVPVTSAAIEIAGDSLTGGIIAAKDNHTAGFNNPLVEIMEAGHPYPDSRGMKSAQKTVSLLDAAGENDIILALISGGGSALWALPAPGITLEEKQKTTDALLGCGAGIEEINCIRKHISGIKGGWAAQHALPAEALVMALSDVIGDMFDVIASGPFYPDSSTFADAFAIVNKYDLGHSLPAGVYRHLEKGLGKEIPDTPKPGENCFNKVTHVLCGSNGAALDACKAEAENLGYKTNILTSRLDGDVRDAANYLINQASTTSQSGKEKICLICGGETTVKLGKAAGRGGRNQELALLFAVKITGQKHISMLSCGTDGTDGPTDAAGAFVDCSTIERIKKSGIDISNILSTHNSYFLFSTIGDLVKTGPTGTNVMDIQVILIDKE
jgi:glycerate 2-kinase